MRLTAAWSRVTSRVMAFCVLSALTTLAGCATERWPRWPATAHDTHGERPGPRLRIAIEPFVNESAVEGDAGVFAGWFLAGLVIVPHATYTAQWDRPQPTTFVHDPGRIFAIALYDQMRHDPNFEVVSFEPFEAEHYDLVVRGRIRRLGFARWLPFVPLPFWVGSLVSMSASKDAVLSEVDLDLRAPLGQSVLGYGVQAGCVTTEPGCGPTYSNELATGLRRGYADFLAHLDRYLESRGDEFWRDARSASRERFNAMLDPTLSRLDEEIAHGSPGRAAALQDWRGERVALLDALRRIEEADERAWADTSPVRVDRETEASNASAEQAQRALVRALAVGAVATVAEGFTAARQFGPNSIQVTAATARGRDGTAMWLAAERARGDERRERIVERALEAMNLAGKDRTDRRRAWLAHYQEVLARVP